MSADISVGVRARPLRAPGSGHALATAAPLAISVDGGATTNGIPPKALQKRLRWLEEALGDERSSGWGSLPTNDRRDALERLRFAIR